MQEQIAKLIAEYMQEISGGRMEFRDDKTDWLYCWDDNWGFDPADLAAKIAAQLSENPG